MISSASASPQRSLCSAGSTHAAAKISNSPPTMETILVGLIALALLAYLMVAMLRPEKF
ncbi:K(+)-transporting ATPase subunit F [Prosthecobacter fluviatilis]|uniref:K(+)-transporting ATPase subunit F n=1 Tax=Prosthecobacter fluviatilis TaxID=445931 RepID=A0ABW0KSU0_9BACT